MKITDIADVQNVYTHACFDCYLKPAKYTTQMSITNTFDVQNEYTCVF